MNPRRVLVPVVAAAVAVVAVAVAGGSSPAAHPGKPGRPGSPTAVDLLSSAHPTGAAPAAVDRAFDARAWAGGLEISADTAALTSTTCDGCAGESTSLQVVYANRARRALLDNVATAWAQGCAGCTGTALSVQVVVLRGRPTAVPNNRALSVTAACDTCRTSALAFQVVLVSEDAQPMGAAELAGLRAWFDEQAAVVRASVTGPLPEPTPAPEPTPTPAPTTTPTTTPTTVPTSATPTKAPEDPGPGKPPSRKLRRDATSALADLEALLTDALDADAVAADVEIGR